MFDIKLGAVKSKILFTLFMKQNTHVRVNDQYMCICIYEHYNVIVITVVITNFDYIAKKSDMSKII